MDPRLWFHESWDLVVLFWSQILPLDLGENTVQPQALGKVVILLKAEYVPIFPNLILSAQKYPLYHLYHAVTASWLLGIVKGRNPERLSFQGFFWTLYLLSLHPAWFPFKSSHYIVCVSVGCGIMVGGSNFPGVSWPAGKLSTYTVPQRRLASCAPTP